MGVLYVGFLANDPYIFCSSLVENTGDVLCTKQTLPLKDIP